MLDAGQLAPPHDVPCAYLWQAPASHIPFVPQVDGASTTHMAAGSGAPAATLVHWPMLEPRAHERHDPVHAVAQHTPCAQKPEAHSLMSEQKAPMGFLPHDCPTQLFGATQSPSARHELKQRAPLQPYGAHGSAGGATHWPAPSHVARGE